MLNLSDYFNLIPQAAMILTSEDGTLSANICYINRAFLDSVGVSPLVGPDEQEIPTKPAYPPDNYSEVPPNFMSILQTQCVAPSGSQFIQWVNEVAQEPEIVHHLKTRFKGFTVSREEFASERTTQFVDIEWNAVVMAKRFIVLMGRKTGAVQFCAVPPQTGPSDLASLAVVEEEAEEAEESDQLPKPVSSRSSSSSTISNVQHKRRSRRPRQSSSSTVSDRSLIGSLKEGSDTSEDWEEHKWRHSEKVYLIQIA